jgi:hypothetical protein
MRHLTQEALGQSGARAWRDDIRCGDARGLLVKPGCKRHPRWCGAIRCAAMQLVQEEHGLCHSLPPSRTILHRSAWISVETTRKSGYGRKNVRFSLFLLCPFTQQPPTIREPTIRRLALALVLLVAFGARGALDRRNSEACAASSVYLFTYVYVVAVNKDCPMLCTTDVYSIRTIGWRTHNRLGSMCGADRFRSITFGPDGATLDLSRMRPHRLHTKLTGVSPPYPQVAVNKSVSRRYRTLPPGMPAGLVRSDESEFSVAQCS